jgi:hypothetical protein
MFQAIHINHPSDIELLDGVPSIRGHGKVVPSLLSQKYALSWKKKTRNEGLALMKEHHLFSHDFVTARNRYNGNFEYDFNEVYYSNTVYIIPAPLKPNGKSTPIRLWKPRGYLDWIADRVAIIVDHWAGANNGLTFHNWVDVIENVRLAATRVQPNWEVHHQLRQLMPKGIDGRTLVEHYNKMFEVQQEVPRWSSAQSVLGYSTARHKVPTVFEYAMALRHYPPADYIKIGHYALTSKPNLSAAWEMYRIATSPYQVIKVPQSQGKSASTTDDQVLSALGVHI